MGKRTEYRSKRNLGHFLAIIFFLIVLAMPVVFADIRTSNTYYCHDGIVHEEMTTKNMDYTNTVSIFPDVISSTAEGHVSAGADTGRLEDTILTNSEGDPIELSLKIDAEMAEFQKEFVAGPMEEMEFTYNFGSGRAEQLASIPGIRSAEKITSGNIKYQSNFGASHQGIFSKGEGGQSLNDGDSSFSHDILLEKENKWVNIVGELRFIKTRDAPNPNSWVDYRWNTFNGGDRNYGSSGISINFKDGNGVLESSIMGTSNILESRVVNEGLGPSTVDWLRLSKELYMRYSVK